MARLLRLQYPNAFYHITARGNEQKAIDRGDLDRKQFLSFRAHVIDRYRLILHAYVLMGNHYYFLLETRESNLSLAFRHQTLYPKKGSPPVHGNKMRVWKPSPIVRFTRFLWIPIFLLQLQGCAMRQIHIDPMERDNLLRNESEIRVVHYALPSLSIFGSPTVIPLEAPLLSVKDRFLATVTAAYSNVRFIEKVRFDDDLSSLKRTFRKGIVFDFGINNWELGPRAFSGKSVYSLALRVRARLIRLDDLKIMWQGICRIGGESPKTWRTLAELTANDYAILKEKRDAMAKKCADQLVAQFSGKEGKTP
jgi:hypothetical protein